MIQTLQLVVQMAFPVSNIISPNGTDTMDTGSSNNVVFKLISGVATHISTPKADLESLHISSVTTNVHLLIRS